jgi:ABC-type multidrug transport system fused ATPase/permease subunit
MNKDLLNLLEVSRKLRSYIVENSNKKDLEAIKIISEEEQKILINFKLYDVVENKLNEKAILFPFHNIYLKHKNHIQLADLKFVLKKNIRDTYCFPLSYRTVALIHFLSSKINQNLQHIQSSSIYNLFKKCNEFLSYLKNDEVIKNFINCFIEAAAFSSQIEYKNSKIEIVNSYIDAENLIGILYGIPTSIKGLDVLFGGEGIILPELIKPKIVYKDLFDDIIPPRTIAITGESGCGKTTLGLQLAHEVAQKGGLVWYMPLEQSINECLYILRSYHNEGNYSYKIGKTFKEAESILQENNKEKGALIFLHIEK